MRCYVYAEAHKRRAEIEYKKNDGTFLPPNKQTVKDVLEDYILLYGEKTWSYAFVQVTLYCLWVKENKNYRFFKPHCYAA